jgi:hypothetical protein
MWSGKSGEIKRFLKSFYQKEVKAEDDISQWIYVYNKPLEAIDIISALMDNKERYKISMFIQIDRGDLYLINGYSKKFDSTCSFKIYCIMFNNKIKIFN